MDSQEIPTQGKNLGRGGFKENSKSRSQSGKRKLGEKGILKTKGKDVTPLSLLSNLNKIRMDFL